MKHVAWIVCAAWVGACSQQHDDTSNTDAGIQGHDAASDVEADEAAGGQGGGSAAGGGGAVDASDASTVVRLTNDPCFALAVNGEYLYALTRSNTLLRVPAAGGTAETVATNISGTSITAASSNVFVGTAGEILRFSQDNVENVVAQGVKKPLGLAVLGADAFWTDYGASAVQKAPTTGGAVTTLVENAGGPAGLAVGATTVVWTDRDGGTVSRVGVDGSAATVLATSQKQPVAVAADGATLYWLNRGSAFVDVSPDDGELVRLGDGDASPVVLVAALNLPASIANDGHTLYWTNWGSVVVSGTPKANGTVMRLQAGSDPEVLAADVDGAAAVALSSNRVYWCAEGAAAAMVGNASQSGGIYATVK